MRVAHFSPADTLVSFDSHRLLVLFVGLLRPRRSALSGEGQCFHEGRLALCPTYHRDWTSRVRSCPCNVLVRNTHWEYTQGRVCVRAHATWPRVVCACLPGCAEVRSALFLLRARRHCQSRWRGRLRLTPEPWGQCPFAAKTTPLRPFLGVHDHICQVGCCMGLGLRCSSQPHVPTP